MRGDCVFSDFIANRTLCLGRLCTADDMSDCNEAAKSGDLHTLECLLKEKRREIFNVSDEMPEGYFPLYWAACKGHRDVCRFLLCHGACPDKTLNTGSTALHAAADRGQVDCAIELITSGCDVNLQNHTNFDSPLHLAAYRGHLAMCELLVTNGASLTLKNIHNRSAHDEALSQNHRDTAEYLYGCWESARSKHRTIDIVPHPNNAPRRYKRTASYPCADAGTVQEILPTPPSSHQAKPSDSAWQQLRSNGGQIAIEQRQCRNKEVPQTVVASSTQNRNTIYRQIIKQESDHFFPVANSDRMSRIGLPRQQVRVDYSKTRQQHPNTQLSQQMPPQELFLANKEVKSSVGDLVLANQGGFCKHESTRKDVNIDRAGNATGHGLSGPGNRKVTNDIQPQDHNATAKPIMCVTPSENRPLQTDDLRKTKTSSENSHFLSNSRISPEMYDYISSLEMQLTNKTDRISFLENKNAKLWQECEDLRAAQSKTQAAFKQKKILTEQVKVLLNEIDQLRKLLQSSEGRSRHLAKQVFHYQQIRELNNNQSQEQSKEVPVSGYTVMEPQGNDGVSKSKNTGSDSDREELPGNHGSMSASTSHCKQKMRARSASSSPKSRSSSRSSGSEPPSPCTPKVGHGPLLEAIRPVFQGAGQAFLMAMTDSLRQQLISTLPKVDETCLDSPGKRWQVGEDFILCDDQPINEITPGCLEGSCSLVYRIQHCEQIYILKMMINLVNMASGGHGEGQSFPLYLFQQFSAEYNIPSALPGHRHVIPVLHHFNGTTLDFQGSLGKLVPSGFDVPLDMANETSFIVLPHYSTTLSRLVERSRQVVAANQVAPICDVICLPEEFITQKLFEVLAAVNHLSQHNVVHRDIKADNIFLDNNLSAVLGDFGMSRCLRSSNGDPIPFVEGNQVLAGNSLAWAPELLELHSRGPPPNKQVYLEDVYASSDVYAIGVMFSSLVSTNSRAPASMDNFSSRISLGLRFILERLITSKARRFTAKKALIMTGIHLFGPTVDEVTKEEDCHTWLQAKMMKLLVCQPDSASFRQDVTLTVGSSIKHNKDLLEREFLSCVKAKDLFQCFQEYRSAVLMKEAKS